VEVNEPAELGEEVAAVRIPLLPAQNADKDPRLVRMRDNVAALAVRAALTFAGAREGRARARASPDRPAIRPSGKAQGSRPSSNTGEEMDLLKTSDVCFFDIDNAPFINFAGRDMPCLDQLPDPRGHPRIDLVIVCPDFQSAPQLRL
jgi:hypothetical protein